MLLVMELKLGEPKTIEMLSGITKVESIVKSESHAKKGKRLQK